MFACALVETLFLRILDLEICFSSVPSLKRDVSIGFAFASGLKAISAHSSANNSSDYQEVMRILQEILQRLISNPSDRESRILRKSNTNFECLSRHEVAINLLFALGFKASASASGEVLQGDLIFVLGEVDKDKILRSLRVVNKCLNESVSKFCY